MLAVMDRMHHLHRPTMSAYATDRTPHDMHDENKWPSNLTSVRGTYMIQCYEAQRMSSVLNGVMFPFPFVFCVSARDMAYDTMIDGVPGLIPIWHRCVSTTMSA